MNDTTQINIYRIDTAHKSLRHKKTADEIVEYIISVYNNTIESITHCNETEKEEAKLTLQSTKEYVKVLKSQKIKIYHFVKSLKPKWNNFFKGTIEDKSDIFNHLNKTSSFVAFYYNENNIYATIGGQAYPVIKDFIDWNFGIEVATRLINEKSNVIHQLQERDLLGTVLGRTLYFKDNHTLLDEDRFGKIYKQLVVELTPNVIQKEFGFWDDEFKNGVICEIKSGFKMRKSVNFSRMLKIMEKIDTILQQEKTIELNKVELVKNISKRIELRKTLCKILYSYYIDRSKELDYQFCHPDFQTFFSASHYRFSYSENKILNPRSIFPLFISDLSALNIKTPEDIEKKLFATKLISYNSEDKIIKNSAILIHLQIELQDEEGKTYFHIDSNWWKINDTFINDLNNQCQIIFHEKKTDLNLLPKKWNIKKGEHETDYNQKYLHEDNYIVLDKIISENIELCDIMYYNEKTLYLIHVKKGFNNSMRDLTNQISISANRLSKTLNDDKAYLKKIYQSFQKKDNNTSDYRKKINNYALIYSEEQFIELFDKSKRNIIFVLAFLDTNIKNYDIEKEIQKFNSNIAKFSLVELYRSMRSSEFEFKICPIKK